MEIREKDYVFSDDKNKINIDDLRNLLKQAPWAPKDRPKEVTEKAVETSLCIGIYHHDKIIGFARIISDFAVYSIMTDLIIDEKHRGEGLARKLVEVIDNHPDIKHTGKVLWTQRASGLYAKCGFKEESHFTLMFKRP